MATDRREIHTYCALCIARCGAIATVEDGRFVKLSPDPDHPTGKAHCAKGRAAPELVYSPDRLHYPMKRTRPKGDPDPGWQRISWDEALDMTAAALRRIADEHGPQAVAFSQASPSTSAVSDSANWIRRLMNAFGTPNTMSNVELCGWARGMATSYTFGVASVGVSAGGGMPDIERAGCIILWGYNPSMTRITHGTAVAEAVKRGAKLIVIDPRHVGLASKADVWLRVRPGSDGALALGLANLMIERGWYDRDFLLRWSNAPMLVRTDQGRLLTERDLSADGSEARLVAWDGKAGAVAIYDPETRRYGCEEADLALDGEVTVATVDGDVACRPVFAAFAEMCGRYTPAVVEATCWIHAADLARAAELIWSARPTAYYAYSGHEQHTNTTQTARAMSLLYALTGCFDQPGGNVLFPSVPAAGVAGQDLPGAQVMAPALGREARPLGPGRFGHVTTREFYRAVLDGEPYPVHGLLGFGANILMAHIVADQGREALAKLDFYAHCDMFMNPTAAYADVVLPVASPFERENLKLGFEINPQAQSRVQLRPAVVPPVGECRGDTEIIFDLAVRLGLGNQFWGGDIDAAYRDMLAPSGIDLETLRGAPGGIDVPLETRHAKYAASGKDGAPVGFATPSHKVELWSEAFRAAGYDPLPDFVEPATGPASRPELAQDFPLVLTSAKNPLFCNTQHRALPSLRKRDHDPMVELHPDSAAARGIAAGDWVRISTPAGSARARAMLNARLDPRVVVGQHGWWQACAAVDGPAYDPFGADSPNYNLLIGAEALDPISGTAPHKSYLCEVRPLA